MENLSAEAQNSPEQLSNSAEEASRRYGSTALAAANFDARHKEIVESSFDKARKNGEKLPGKNNERRTYAYLSRLEKLIDKYGNEAEKRLWQASIKDDLLVEYDNIPESYWQAKKQELRDNGYGGFELTEEYKREIFEKERELQEESLEKWATYLGDEHSPYPLWFKVYAWDGMTKMGKYDKSKGKYATRNETTVAPYPNPDAEVLGGVFEVVNRYYGNNDREFYTEDGERNIELEKVVQSGNFPKIYNAIEHDIAPIIEPPENPEDVHGEWIEYSIGEEDDIARAARGTGWCVASPSVGKHYLEYGTYGQDDDWGDDFYGETNDEVSSLKSKFILFHLEDSSTGKLSKNAVASIRLDPDGNVAEISGLREGQALNDSLVDMVAEKVKTLPGGEKYLGAFADKQELVRLDRKMQSGEDLTKEEIEFIYEMNRPIQTLDTYNDNDPRIDELRRKYDMNYALNAGVNVDNLVPKLGSSSIAKNLDTLIDHGANIDNLVSELYRDDVALNLDTLIAHGANIDNLVSELCRDDVALNLDTLIAHGANIDNLVSSLDPSDIVKDLDTLIDHGANIDNLVSSLYLSDIAKNLDTLIAHGANIDNLVSSLDPSGIVKNLDTLIAHGANIDIGNLVSSLDPSDIVKNLDTLIDHGANIDGLVANLRGYQVVENLDTLIAHGANIDIDNLVSSLDSSDIVKNLDTLIDHGANIDGLVANLLGYQVVENLDTLIAHGANIDNLVSELYRDDVVENLDTLIDHGANIDNLVSNLNLSDIVENLDTLIAHGANIDIDNLVANLRRYQVVENLDTLIDHGANIDIDNLVSNLWPSAIVENLGTLIAHGANIDINDLVSNLKPYEVTIFQDTLRAHGWQG